MNFVQQAGGQSVFGETAAATIGIRPEKMVGGKDFKFTVDIDMTELLGSEKIAYFYINGQKCTAKLPADYPVGKTLELSINKKDLYFFDESGNRV